MLSRLDDPCRAQGGPHVAHLLGLRACGAHHVRASAAALVLSLPAVAENDGAPRVRAHCCVGCRCHLHHQINATRRAMALWADRRSFRCARQWRSEVSVTRSTIAAAISACGQFMATTHGDHTIKVSRFDEGGQGSKLISVSTVWCAR